MNQISIKFLNKESMKCEETKPLPIGVFISSDQALLLLLKA